MGLTEHLVPIIVSFIENIGYAGVFVLMVLESMIMPVPSEAVMPFAGWLIVDPASKVNFTLAGVIFFSTLGSIVGSLISYYLGYYGGRPLVERWGKYLLLNKHHLDITEKYFNKRGELTIFISRFIPIVRHLISIPAGTGKMNIWKFSIYTIVGAGMWNTFLAYIGMMLNKKWEVVLKYSSIIDIVVVALLALLFIYTFMKLYKAYRKSKTAKIS